MARIAPLLALLVAVACAADLPRKQLSGPPSEFASHALPDSTAGAVSTSHATYVIMFNENGPWTQTLSVDSSTQFIFAVFSAMSGVETKLVDPAGNVVDLASHAQPTSIPAGDSEVNIPATMYTFDNPIEGNYMLSLTLTATSTRVAKGIRGTNDGYVILWNDSQDQILTHLTTYSFIQGQQVGLSARMFDSVVQPFISTAHSNFTLPTAMRDVVASASLDAVYPDGTIVETPMFDDGDHSDGAANDGIFGATIFATEEGQYMLRAQLKGSNKDGSFIRTSEHLIQVVPQYVTLTGKATASLDLKQHRALVNLGVSSQSSETFRAYFQLWGKNPVTKADVPICWSSALVDTQTIHGMDAVQLEVDLKWIALAMAVGPYTLKDVYVVEIDSLVPMATVDSIPLEHTMSLRMLDIAVARVAATFDGKITTEMLEGVRPAMNTTAAPNGGKLIVVHGYCASANPFAAYPADWTDALFFTDLKQSRSHDQFAQLIVQFANNNGLSSYGLVGHSQGGLASVHVLNYYHTGLDNAVGARKIQSLGSPYRGNSGASNYAAVIELFGDCEANPSLTRDVSEQWIAGLSATTIAATNYYTTQYNTGIGKAFCNGLMNTILQKPNDGATENVFAAPPGGNNRGNTLGQCHLDGMKYPASFWDHSRNAEMSAAAAR